MLNFDSLLTPVSADAPCGKDPSQSGLLFELETAILGKPETQFSAAEEPIWKDLRLRLIDVLGEVKDLRIAGIFSATLLRTHGIEGLSEGVGLIRRYLESYWTEVHPLLDASDNNDPSERINALSNLAAPLGSDGDVLKIISALRAAPLVQSVRVGDFTLSHYLAVKGLVPWAGGGDAPTAALLDAVIKDAVPEKVKAAANAAQELLSDLSTIEKIFKTQSGPRQFPTFDPLRKELKHIVAWLGADTATPAPTPAPAPAPAAAANPGPIGTDSGFAFSSTGAPRINGAIQNRDDVVAAIDGLITYYKTTEPSSPVPFLLARLRRIVRMNFIELMTELTPEALEKITVLTGPVESDSAPKN